MKYAALFVCILFILWLFAKDRKLRPLASPALWIPLMWIIIIGSRTVSLWIDPEIDPEMVYSTSLEGSPLDRNVFLVLIIGGMIALWKRRLNLVDIFASNPWLFAFFLYCGASIVWSDFPFASLKKWFKDLGNIVMVLLILTEANRVLAFRAVFARYVYFAVPVSALLIMFFPEFGSYTVPSVDETAYCGVATNKNELGNILAIIGMFLTWELIDRRPAAGSKTDAAIRLLLLAMVIWLLIMVNSVTALVCMTIGIAVLLCARIPLVKRQFSHLGIYGMAAGFLVLLLYSFPAIKEGFFEIVGREATFTGRTDIWEGLLSEPVNPIVGTGFQSFWIQPGIMERYDLINEAHSGYLETYLNGGVIGLFLLTAMIFSAWNKLKRELMQGSTFAALLFSFLVVNLAYNLTESVFNRLGLAWFAFLIAALNCPGTPIAAPEKTPAGAPPVRNRRLQRVPLMPGARTSR